MPRVDGHLKTSGAAKYTHDINLPDMQHALVLRSPHACAVIKSIDIKAAENAPGVSACVALAKAGDRVLFVGQDVAAVAAATPEAAREALARIQVEYEKQPFVVALEKAMQDDAPLVHTTAVKERRTEGDEPGAGGGAKARGNIRPAPSMKKGDAKRGLRQAKVTHEAVYTTQVHTHTALETHSIVVRWDDAKQARMTVWCSTQSIFSVRGEMAEMFGLKPQDVHVITNFLGGGFGAKFGASAPGSRLGFIAGELARLSKKPVSLLLDRREEHTCTGNRPDSHQRVTLGATEGGALTAIHVVGHGSAGIGTGAGIGRNAFGIYTKCPNILVESADVFTHAGPGTAFRAPGHPQGAFGIESALNELAAKLGLDPLELRIAHNEHPVRRRQFELGRDAFQWADKRRRAADQRGRNTRMRTGVGVAASIWGDFGRAKAASVTVTVTPDGGVEVRNGVQDIGTGIGTVMAQVAAEVLRRPLSTVTVKIGDSELGSSVGSGGSQTTSSVTPAVRNAAEQVKARLIALAAEALEAPAAKITWGEGGVASARKGKSIEFAALCKKIKGESISESATRPQTYGSHPMKFLGSPLYQIAGVQFAEVEVDTWTGVARARKVLAIHDCGRVMNELTLRSQINGGVILGTGYALMEQRVMDGRSGVMLNANLESYKCLGARDVPEIEVLLTEVHVGNNSTGAVGIGEPATIPTAAAIAGAVMDAIGAPVRALPITPDRVLTALGATS